MKVANADNEYEVGGERLGYYEADLEDEAKLYEFYIDEIVKEPKYYRDLIHVLLHTTEKDVVLLRINSPGGVLDACLGILNALRNTKATTHAYVVGSCQSAAAVLAMACDTIELDPYTMFMIHTFSGASVGTSNKIVSESNYNQMMVNNLYRDVFRGFLTEDEFSLVLDRGVDLYLTADEIETRLKAKEVNEVSHLSEQLNYNGVIVYGYTDDELATVLNDYIIFINDSWCGIDDDSNVLLRSKDMNQVVEAIMNYLQPKKESKVVKKRTKKTT